MENETARIRLFLLDGHEPARTALRRLLVVEGFDVAGECATAAGAMALLVQAAGDNAGAGRTVDIVLMETHGLDVNPMQACRDIRARFPSVRVVFLASAGDISMRVRGILAGADGYLTKDAGIEALARTLRAVAGGSHIIDGETLQWLREKAAAATGGAPRTESLSPQEKKIVPLVAEGMTNKQIGEVLGLSHKTVKNHLSNVFQKLQVSRRSQLAAIVAGAGAG